MSFELIPEEKGDLHKIMNGVRKADFSFDDSNEIEQSDIIFNLWIFEFIVKLKKNTFLTLLQ